MVASGRGFVIHSADVEATRAMQTPPPSRDRAARLTIDSWLAEWIATGRIGHATDPERRAFHNELARLSLEERLSVLQTAKQETGLVAGPCYPESSDSERR